MDPINDEWYNLCKGNRARNTERQFVELTASSYEYCYANPVRFTDPTGEQATPEQITPSLRPAQDVLAPQPAQLKPVSLPPPEQQGLRADVHGNGHMGPESQVNTTVNGINKEYYDAVGANIAGGPFGALGYFLGGEKGSFAGAQLDAVSQGAFFHKVEPVLGARSRKATPSPAELKSNMLEPEVKNAEFKAPEINTLEDPRAYELATGGSATSNIPLTKKTFGHTFTTHGENMTGFLLNRAKGSGAPQGQFLDNQKAAQFILANLSKTSNGAVSIPVPSGFPARVIMPDGTFKQPTHIRLIPSGQGVKTAYPLIQ